MSNTLCWTISVLSAGLILAQSQPKSFKNQAEADLAAAINKESDWRKKLPLLLDWKARFADTEFREERLELIATGYQQTGQAAELWKTALDLNAINPRNIAGLFFLTAMAAGSTDSARVETGSKAARVLLDAAAGKRDLELAARKTLGWTAYASKRFDEAETELTSYLKAAPESGLASYWLGLALVAQKTPAKQMLSFHHLARAAKLTAGDALAPAARTQAEEFVRKNYTAYHGSADGLPELFDQAAKSAFPAEGFQILSKAEVDAAALDKLRIEDPGKFVWMQARQQLIAATGLKYFDEEMKGTALPKIEGRVISATPAGRPREIVLAITGDEPELKLVLDAPLPSPPPPGIRIAFEGAVPQSFAPQPFLLTASVERAKISGWPASAPK